jgi:hypothetical protein
MFDCQLTEEEEKHLKENMLKFVERHLDPRCEADRTPEGMKIVPILIEILIRRF